MGKPDGAPPAHVVEKLAEVARNPKAHGYSASKGISGLRKAQAGYYARRFGVELDPESEVIVTLGSKEGLANLAQAITAPGDVVLAPNPSYPIHQFGFIIRSEEHTSELQSLMRISYAVFCLKKKTTSHINQQTTIHKTPN